MPAGWESTTLGDICEKPQYGWTTKADQREDGIRLLRTTDITKGPINWSTVPVCQEPPEDFAKYQLRAGDVVVSRAGSVGYSALLEDDPPVPSVFASYLIRMRPRMDVEPRYVKWFMQSPKYWQQISDSAAGIAVQNVNAKRLAAIQAPLPPIDDQRCIVEAIETYLSHLDAGVASLERARRNLERVRAALLAHAVMGRLVAQSPDDEPVGGLEDLGEKIGTFPLPPSWIWTTFELISPRVTVGHVGPMKHAYVREGGVPFLRSQNVRENRFDPHGLVFVDAAFEADLEKSRLSPGDILVVRSGNVGVTCVVPDSVPTANCADLVIVKKPELVAPEFAAFYMNSVARRLVAAGTTGSALTHFNTKSVASLPIPVPPLPEQRRIIEEVQRQFSILDALESEISASERQSEALRRSTLQAAFSGRLRNNRMEVAGSITD